MTRRARTLADLAEARRRERDTAAAMARWAAEVAAEQAERDRAHAAAPPAPEPAPPPPPPPPPPPTRHPASRITVAEAARRINIARRERDTKAELEAWSLVHPSEHRAVKAALPRRTGQA